jgi:hypothetical protein
MQLRHILLILSAALAASPASAGTYEALCGTAECTITLSPQAITTPYGIIPTTRVANWGGTGTSSQDLVLGAAATYVLGPVGLIGFLAKTHDYNYLITGYDQLGNRTSVQIKFQNNTPAKRFVQEMVEITGLGMGQVRTATDIKALERRVASQGISAIKLPALSLDQEYAKEKGNSSAINVSERASECWSVYITRRPDVELWASANPKQAQEVRSKYGDC